VLRRVALHATNAAAQSLQLVALRVAAEVEILLDITAITAKLALELLVLHQSVRARALEVPITTQRQPP
jgi:hypothetical protein